MKKFKKYNILAQELNDQGPWTFKNSKMGNQYLNILWFINKLSDSKY
jgi:hypothetical protein